MKTNIMTVQEFTTAFPDEEACDIYLAQRRWPDGYTCPRCGCGRYSYITTRRLYQCCDCHYQCSLIAGTIFQDTKLPLLTWFWAIYFIVTIKKSISSAELGRKVGIKKDRNARNMHLKILEALSEENSFIQPFNRGLKGVVEVDETLYGPNKGEPGRSHTKAKVVCAVEDKGKHMGRIAMRVIPSETSDNLHDFVEDHIARGATVATDGLASYNGLDELGYVHEARTLYSPKAASKLLPWVHISFSNLKRVLNGTHAGVSRGHLSRYSAGFTFRLNHRYRLNRAFEHAFDHLTSGLVVTRNSLVAEIGG